MTFKWNRMDVIGVEYKGEETTVHVVAADDGSYVRAFEAINREAVNADRIRTLELQLKEARQALKKS